jgi:cytochrome c oxidase subunit 2
MYVYILISFWYYINYPKTIAHIERRKIYFLSRKINHYAPLETYWTLVPTIILLFIAVPSFQLLYSMETIFDSFIVIKATGHQWYWNYEVTMCHPCSDCPEPYIHHDIIDCYMVVESDLPEGTKRLLTVDNNLEIPYGVHLVVKVTSADVLHSWAVPSLGIKMDAVPGRLNQVPLYVRREGIHFGQCSEICGAGHAYMPIVVVSYDAEAGVGPSLISKRS